MTIERLSVKDVKEAQPKPGGKLNTLNDGGGLILLIRPGKRGPLKHWAFRYAIPGSGRGGKERRMGLGPEYDYSLTEARAMATDARKLLRRGIDPLEAKREQAAAQKAARTTAVTFDEMAEAYLAAHEASWKSSAHRTQWRQSLRDHILPIIGNMDVASIGEADVLRVLTPIWRLMPETADRVRGRIEVVLDFAGRNGSNPAKWDTLRFKLPKKARLRTVKHYAALPYDRIPAFMAELRAVGTLTARALEFLILTAKRSAEVLGATWSEIDSEQRIWTIPVGRLKRPGEEEDGSHSVPLSDAATAMLRGVPRYSGDQIFVGMGSDAMLHLLQQMRPVTVQGMRAAFRSWAGAETATPRDICEMALGHKIGSAVERAYQRSALLAKRRVLMNAWAEFCSSGVGRDGDGG
jgi:integrase